MNHIFRNPNTQRAQALRWLPRGHNPKQIMLLTATPVNNSLWDLYYQLQYFIRNDAAFTEIGIRSMRERFHTAQDQDPFSLNSRLFVRNSRCDNCTQNTSIHPRLLSNDTVPIRNQITGEIERRQMVSRTSCEPIIISSLLALRHYWRFVEINRRGKMRRMSPN